MTGSGKTDEQPPAGELAALKAEHFGRTVSKHLAARRLSPGKE